MNWDKELAKMSGAVLKQIHELELFLQQEHPTAWEHWKQYRDVQGMEWAQDLINKIKEGRG